MSDCLLKNVRRISRENLRNRRLRMFADFIRHLSARKGSVAAWMRKEVITPAILDSKSKRANFLDAWSKQRSKEFVPKKKAKQS